MGDKLNISAHELNASGGAADTIAGDLADPLKQAVSDAEDAGSALRHWEVGTELTAVAERWGVALEKLCDRIRDHADGLRLVARGHAINEQDVSSKFKGWA
ncbi:MAG: hypothetical protein ACRDOV_14775 [Streptomyces sp.]